jgi:glucan 1,3-beta-glucosidase
MAFFNLIHVTASLFFIISTVCAKLTIPEVDAVVANVLVEFADYVHYQGNQSEASTSEASAIHERQTTSTPYWYETITHQGISAFGPSGYQVYRNVMDYGATGKLHL